MAEKTCNTINQNIEPHNERKLLNNYSKQIGTLLNSFGSSDRNDLPNIPSDRYLGSNVDYKTSRQLDLVGKQRPCTRRSENTVMDIEAFMKTLPKDSMKFSRRKTLNLICPSTLVDDTLSDVDLENFDPNNIKPDKVGLPKRTLDKAETTSLSNFHNVSDALLYFSNRLESFLKTNNVDESGTKDSTLVNGNCLKENISDLKRELERYVDIINEKKENELRKFSENMMKQSKILQMQNAFSRQQKLKTNIYETLESGHTKYAIADNESMPDSFRYFRDRICLGDSSSLSDYSSIECYTMLINEDRTDNLLNDAPHPRYCTRGRVSLIFPDTGNIIKQWQNLQSTSKQKSMRSLWSKRYSLWPNSESFWGFTLDSHRNEILEEKLEEERRMRLILRLVFGFLSIVTFVFIVFLVESMFSYKNREPII